MKRFLFLPLLALLVLPACQHTDATSPDTVEGVMVHRPVYEIEDETWVLFQLEGKSVELTSDPRRPALRLSAKTDGQRVSGSGGVNRVAGSYEIDQGVLKFGPLITTKMAGDPAKMELEQRFLAALSRVTGWQRKDRLLVLLEGTNPIAQFVQQTDGPGEPWK